MVAFAFLFVFFLPVPPLVITLARINRPHRETATPVATRFKTVASALAGCEGNFFPLSGFQMPAVAGTTKNPLSKSMDCGTLSRWKEPTHIADF